MKWTPEIIRERILSDQRWLERAVVAIYRQQTEKEQDLFSTEDYNERGFSTENARIGTIMARWIMQGNRLSGKYIGIAKKVMPKYAKQLAEIANEREEAKEEANAS